MNPFRSPLAALALAAGSSLFAGDYDAMLDTVKRVLPGKTLGVVACHLEGNKAAVRELAEAAHHRGLKLRFLDIPNAGQVNAATGNLPALNAEFALIVDSDPVVGSNGSKTKSLTSAYDSLGMPSFATDEAAVKNGATLAIGPKTQGKVVPNAARVKYFRLKV